MCSAWVLCGKEAESTSAAPICNHPAPAATHNTASSLFCLTIEYCAAFFLQNLNPQEMSDAEKYK